MGGKAAATRYGRLMFFIQDMVPFNCRCDMHQTAGIQQRFIVQRATAARIDDKIHRVRMQQMMTGHGAEDLADAADNDRYTRRPTGQVYLKRFFINQLRPASV